MISDIFIKGFQSHKQTYLELAEFGVTALIGDTGTGKSAVIKALLWLFTNRPVLNWDDYRSYWADETEVAVGLTDPVCHVGRVRNKAENYYYIDKPGEKLQQLTAFGKGPPPQAVLDILQLAEVNFQTQMSLPFMLSQSSGAVGRFLNDAADLAIIDRSTSNIASILRNEKTELSAVEISFKTDTEQLKQFDWVSDAEGELVELEKEDRQLDAMDDQIKNLEGLIHDLEEVQKRIGELSLVVDAREEVYDLENERQRIEKERQKEKQLRELTKEIKNFQTDMKSLSKTIRAEPEVNRLISFAEEKNKLREKYQLLYLLTTDIKTNKKAIIIEKSNLKIKEEAFHKAFPEVCPLCEK